MKPIVFTETPVMRYAVSPGDAGGIRYIDGMREHWPKLPRENDVLTVPFLVDTATGRPVPVRVVQIQNRPDMTPQTIVIVVGRCH